METTMGVKSGFSAITEFEQMLSDYTGAPYVVVTDCCTHAIELCFRIKNVNNVTLPYRSYISIPMTMHKLDIKYNYVKEEWQYEYRIGNTNICDSARGFDKNMYRTNQVQCLSFGHSKRLEIGHGGAILTDNKQDAELLRLMRYDGRDLTVAPWQAQKTFRVGYHYKPSIEDCEKGLYMLANNKLKTKESQQVKYPDLTEIEITD